MHSVLHSTHQYRECLQLADIIADDQHQLYKVSLIYCHLFV